MNINPLWTSTEADIVTGGRSSCPWQATGVTLNVDEIQPGDLFLAAPDDDINAAYARGAAVVAVPHDVHINTDRPVLKMGSAFMTLHGLACAARYRTHAVVVSVQGRQARADMVALLSSSMRVHDAGKHVSLGMANLPEDVDFGVFSASPAVQPDIVVITNPESANRDTMFENMPLGAAVIINADGEGYIDIIARAKAAGIGNILTYGRNLCADAAIDKAVFADNGIRLEGAVMDEKYALVVPTEYCDNSMILAALLILKLNRRPLHAIVPCAEHARQRPEKTQAHVAAATAKGVTLMDKGIKEANANQTIFKVRNMVDLGFGRQTAVLDNLGYDLPYAEKQDLQVPRKFANFDLVYAAQKGRTGGVHTVKDSRKAIQAGHGKMALEQVAPDVMRPGDFLVFREIWNSSRTIFTEALRVVPEHNRKTQNAL